MNSRGSIVHGRAPRALGLAAALGVSGICLTAASCKKHELEWQTDGTVTRGAVRLHTKLQSVTTGLRADGGVYLGGYQIDAAGVNYPTIAFIPSDLKEPVYWSREDSIQQLFLLGGAVSLVETSGSAFERRGTAWARSDLRFKPRSVVISATEPLVACNPAPLRMASQERGSCYSPTAGWSVDVNWRPPEPAMCDGALTVIEALQDELWARQLRTTDGAETAAVKLAALPSHACEVRFDTRAR